MTKILNIDFNSPFANSPPMCICIHYFTSLLHHCFQILKDIFLLKKSKISSFTIQIMPALVCHFFKNVLHQYLIALSYVLVPTTCASTTHYYRFTYPTLAIVFHCYASSHDLIFFSKQSMLSLKSNRLLSA